MRISISGIGYEEADVPRPLAFDALEAQNATVLSSVVREMGVAAQALAAHQRCGGTAWRNHHPIMLLYANAITRISTGSCGIGTASVDDAKKLCRAVTGSIEIGPGMPGPAQLIEDWHVKALQQMRDDLSNLKTDAEVYDMITRCFAIPATQSEVRKRYDGFRIGGASVATAWSKTFEVNEGE